MSFDLESWFNSINGKYVDADGAYGGQCHDVFLSYLLALGGNKNDGHAPGADEATHNVWTHFPNHRPGLARIFTKHTGSIQRGDVVFYSRYEHAGTHVVVARTGVGADGKYEGIDQNPHPVRAGRHSTTGMVGVLRPKQHILGNAPSKPSPKNNPTDPQEEDEMKTAGFFYRRGGDLICIITNPVSGLFHEYAANDGVYNSKIATAFGTGDFPEISVSHARKLEEDMAKVREGKR